MNLKGIVQSKINILSTFNFVHTVKAIECCSSKYLLHILCSAENRKVIQVLNNTRVMTELSILRQTIPLSVCVCFTLILSAMYSEASRRVEWAVSVSVVMNQPHIQLNTRSLFLSFDSPSSTAQAWSVRLIHLFTPPILLCCHFLRHGRRTLDLFPRSPFGVSGDVLSLWLMWSSILQMVLKAS